MLPVWKLKRKFASELLFFREKATIQKLGKDYGLSIHRNEIEKWLEVYRKGISLT